MAAAEVLFDGQLLLISTRYLLLFMARVTLFKESDAPVAPLILFQVLPPSGTHLPLVVGSGSVGTDGETGITAGTCALALAGCDVMATLVAGGVWMIRATVS